MSKKKQTAIKETASKTPEEPVIYLGKDIPGVAVRNTVYNNGIPGSLAELINKNALLKYFLVPLSKAMEAENAIKQKGSALNIFYSKL